MRCLCPTIICQSGVCLVCRRLPAVCPGRLTVSVTPPAVLLHLEVSLVSAWSVSLPPCRMSRAADCVTLSRHQRLCCTWRAGPRRLVGGTAPSPATRRPCTAACSPCCGPAAPCPRPAAAPTRSLTPCAATGQSRCPPWGAPG